MSNTRKQNDVQVSVEWKTGERTTSWEKLWQRLLDIAVLDAEEEPVPSPETDERDVPALGRSL